MIDPTDLRIDVFRAGFTPPAVRITHLPTGLTAKATHRSEIQAKQMALEELERLVASY